MAIGGNYKNINLYAGADYGLDPEYGKDFLDLGYRIPTGQFGFPTDPTTGNQLEAVSKKLSTGAKTIEVSGLNIMGGGPGALMEKIPEQHLEEINRLRKLAGVDLTFHGPLIEPTGFQGRQGWQEIDREKAERQMWLAVKRAHKMKPDGNLVVTFHSSNGLPETETVIYNEKTKKEEVKDFWAVDELNGQFRPMNLEPNYFKSSEEKYKDKDGQLKAINELIKDQNESNWFKQLQGISYHANQGEHLISGIISGKAFKQDQDKLPDEVKSNPQKLLEYYKAYLEGKGVPQAVQELKPEFKEVLQSVHNEMVHGDNYLRSAYHDLQALFNQAYAYAKKNGLKEDLTKMDDYRSEIKEKVKYLEEPEKLQEFGEEIIRGVNVLRSISAPRTLKPLREFGVDKSSETFANIAFNSYSEFKDKAPIISIENPPAGGGLARADDLRQVVEKSRKKLAQRLIEEEKISETKAEKIAEKMIGVTWDVGHINMIRGMGYSDKDVVKETERIAKFVKHVHLSDNFGIEHTELPMGMGNVPLKPMLDLIQEYNKKVKKIVETGDWFSRQGGLAQTSTPFRETLRAFGSPLYAMQAAPYWNQTAHASGGYFAGYGQTLPDQHFQIYGAGFSNMPVELGGQMSGRSRASGAPIE